MRVGRGRQVDGGAQVGVGIVGTVEQACQPRRACDQFFVEFVGRAADGLDEFPGAGQTLVRRGEFVETMNGVAERREFVDLVADEALVFPGASDLGAASVEFVFRRLPFAETLGRGRDELRIDAELVEETPLNITGEHLAMFVLAVDVDQRAGDRLQCRKRGGHAVDEGSGTTLAGVASHEAGVFVALEEHVERVEDVPGTRPSANVEFRAHVAPGGAGPDGGASRAGAEHETEGIEEDGLSRTRLAGDDGQPGAELDVEFRNQGEVANVERFQHGRYRIGDGKSEHGFFGCRVSQEQGRYRRLRQTPRNAMSVNPENEQTRRFGAPPPGGGQAQANPRTGGR